LIHPIRRNLLTLPAADVDFIKRWLAVNRNNPSCRLIEDLPLPKWQFLTFLCDHLGLLAHGSDRTDLEALVPVAKQRGDLSEFGNATQIFATPDALWAMWFALLNRNMKFGGTANNCTRHLDENGRVFKTYWFSVARENLTDGRPLANGMIYLVHPDRFLDKNGEEWGARETVTPIAKLAVSPDDWPLTPAILGFERERLWERLEQSPDLFPYFDDHLLWKIIPQAYRTPNAFGSSPAGFTDLETAER
jgi:hypothetical protein